MKEKQFANKELEMEKEELEQERKLLIEEKFKFEEIMKELFEEEMKRENEDSDDDSVDSDDEVQQDKVETKPNSSYKIKSRALSSKYSPDEEEEKVPVRTTRYLCIILIYLKIYSE